MPIIILEELNDLGELYLLTAFCTGNSYLNKQKFNRIVPPSSSIYNSAIQCSSCVCLSAAKSLQSCLTLCNPIDGNPTGSPVPGIPQARTLEWVAISFSNAWKWKVKVKLLSRVRLLATPWTAAFQAPPSMGFFRQEYRSGVPLPLHCLSNII